MIATTPIEKLVAMSNQIASFFHAYPEDQACAGIRDHIRDFWTPRMRASIQTGDHPGLDPLVARALQNWPRAESPIAKTVASPDKAGTLASDAG